MIIDVDIKYEAYGLLFIWSKNKSFEVRKKHQVSFEDVVDVFLDRHAEEVPSGDIDGANLALIGECKNSGVVFVAYAYRNGNQYTRLISARLADATEKNKYMNNVLRNLGISLPKNKRRSKKPNSKSLRRT